MADDGMRICGGANLATAEGLIYALTREEEKEVVGCAMAIMESSRMAEEAEALRHASPVYVARFLSAVGGLPQAVHVPPLDDKQPTITAAAWHFKEGVMSAFGQTMPLDMLTEIVVHKATSSEQAVALGHSIGAGETPERKATALDFIENIVETLARDPEVARSFGEESTTTRSVSLSNLATCFVDYKSCYADGGPTVTKLHPNRQLQTAAAAIVGLDSIDAAALGSNLDHVSKLLNRRGFWPSVLEASINYSGQQEISDGRVQGFYSAKPDIGNLLRMVLRAGSTDTCTSVANALGDVQRHLAELHPEQGEGDGLRSGAVPASNFELLTYMLRYRDANPPHAPAGDLPELHRMGDWLASIAAKPVDSLDALQCHDAATALLALGHDAKMLSDTMAPLSAAFLKQVVAGVLGFQQLPGGELIAGLVKAAYDSRDAAACNKLADALETASKERGERSTGIAARAQKPPPETNYRDVVLLLRTRALANEKPQPSTP